MRSKKKIIIIGGGPSGIAASIQLKRSNFDPILIEKEGLGGLIKNANLVENYPGFPEGITGVDLVETFIKQLEKFAIRIKFEKVESLDYLNIEKKFEVRTNINIHYSDIVIIASGTKALKLDLSNILSKNIKKYLIYDVYLHKKTTGKSFVIVGAGDLAFDYALTLIKENQVIILNKGSDISALPLLKDKVFQNNAIEYRERSEIHEIDVGNNKPLLLRILKNQTIQNLEVDFLLTAIGRIPQKDFYSGGLLVRESELISKGLLYLIGDIKNEIYRQISIAIGNGIETAMRIYFDK